MRFNFYSIDVTIKMFNVSLQKKNYYSIIRYRKLRYLRQIVGTMNNRGLIFFIKKRKINNDQNKFFYRIYKFDIHYIIFNLINPIDR